LPRAIIVALNRRSPKRPPLKEVVFAELKNRNNSPAQCEALLEPLLKADFESGDHPYRAAAGSEMWLCFMP
jgi:hypothetical protein